MTLIKNLPLKKFKTVVIDPPWPISQSVDMPYKTMTISAIAGLPIRQLTEKDCYVFLWTPNSMMEEAYGILRLWKLKHVQTITWCKHYGLGRPPYTATEHILMARAGQLKRGHDAKLNRTLADGNSWQTNDLVMNWFNTYHRPKHSEKPQEAYDIIQSVSQEPRLEMFARVAREGWVTCGDELQLTK